MNSRIELHRKAGTPPLDTGLLDHAARSMVQAFAGCLLLPVRPGVDPDSVPLPLVTEVGTGTRQAKLATDNIAVALGLNDGLFATEFRDEDTMESFLNKNPASRSTLVTTHDGRPVLWHRARTAHRVSLFLPGMTVLMRGNFLILKRGGLELTDLILSPALPFRVNPETVDWGIDEDGLIDSWLARLSHGEFFRRNTQGRAIPNRRAWCYYLTRRLRKHVAYSAEDREFHELSDAGEWRPLPEDQLLLRLRELITLSPLDAAEAKARLSAEWLHQVGRRLKTSLARHLPLTENRVRLFMDRHLMKEPGANVTNAELTAAFEAHCRQTGQPLLSANKFKVVIGRVLRGDPWLVGYSKSIRRPGGQQNGWRGVRLRDQGESLTTTHGADGAPGVKS